VKEVVLEARGLLRGSSGPALETFLRRAPGIHHANANYLSETVVVGFDEDRTSEAEVRHLVEQCGYHCGGEVVPRHVCAPDAEVVEVPRGRRSHALGQAGAPAVHAGHAPPAAERVEPQPVGHEMHAGNESAAPGAVAGEDGAGG